VVTRLEFRLQRLDRVVGGLLEFCGSAVADNLRRFRDLVASSPPDVSCQAILALDESLTPTLTVAPCYTGTDTDPGELRELRSWAGLVNDDVRSRTFIDQQLVFDSPYGENRHYWKGHFVSELTDELIEELLDRLLAFGRPPVHVLIESLHGAPKAADPALGPIAYRDAAFNVSAMAVWANADEDEQHMLGLATLRRRSSRGPSVAATPTTCRRTNRSSVSVRRSAKTPSNGCRLSNAGMTRGMSCAATKTSLRGP
jgi:hypothetical protein